MGEWEGGDMCIAHYLPNTAAEAKWKILMRLILVWEKLMDIMQVRVEGPRWIAGATSGLGLMIYFIFA